MRDELMTEALCWQTGAGISADDAYEYKQNDSIHLDCYCPHDDCFAEVHPARKKHTYFVARAKHAPGCPNEARSSESSSYPGEPKPRDTAEPPAPIPTLLGPTPPIKPKSGKPTREDLLKLAATFRVIPAQRSGTLEEVIDAWTLMTRDERVLRPLTIGNETLTYETAFIFLGRVSNDIHTLNSLDRIIFGAATVEQKEHYYIIKSRRKFVHEAGNQQLCLTPGKTDRIPEYFATLANQDATLFWHGVTPTFSGERKAFRFGVDFRSEYVGIALRPGELVP